MKLREYRAPLIVLTAGGLGFSLFCIVSAAAMAGPSVSSTPIDLQPQDLVDSAVSNINTVAALTLDSLSEFIPTATLSPSNTNTVTDAPTDTATLQPTPTRTRIPPTNTKDRSGSPPTSVPTRLPTRTSTPVPTDTNTPVPTFTQTSIPPTATNTPVPPTDTPPEPATNTPQPEPTATEPPVETLSPNDVTENSP